MKDSKNKGKKEKDTTLQENAINKKSNEADGKEINHQVEQRKEQHQPRDNA